MNEEDEAFEDLAKRQGDWGLQGSRKHQIMREVQRLGQEIEATKRKWVDLTDEEIDNINYTSAHMLAREVLAKFKEKNT